MSFKKAVTIRDVSARAGVSTATVSRVLNTPELVKEETRQLVLRAVQELNFEPSSSLTRKNQQALQEPFVYLLLPNLFNAALTQIAQGAADYLQANHIHSVIWNSNESIQLEQQGHLFFQSHPAQGVIVIMSTVEDIPLGKIAERMPIVTVEYYHREENIDTIQIDNERAMDLLVGHLAQLGHRDIGFLCGDISSSNSLRKIAAFKKAILSRQLPWKANRLLSTQWDIPSGFHGVQTLLNGCPELTAVVCISDLLALGAVHGAQHLGLRCPEDLSITGFDHLSAYSCLGPKLTTLDYPSYQMGQAAAKQLLYKMQNKKASNCEQVFPLTLLPGESTAAARSKYPPALQADP